jgi:hypothetical protein
MEGEVSLPVWHLVSLLCFFPRDRDFIHCPLKDTNHLSSPVPISCTFDQWLQNESSENFYCFKQRLFQVAWGWNALFNEFCTLSAQEILEMQWLCCSKSPERIMYSLKACVAHCNEEPSERKCVASSKVTQNEWAAQELCSLNMGSLTQLAH